MSLTTTKKKKKNIFITFIFYVIESHVHYHIIGFFVMKFVLTSIFFGATKSNIISGGPWNFV